MSGACVAWATSLPRKNLSGFCVRKIRGPSDELADRLAELPDDGQIVAYCRGAYCVLAHDAVRLLTARGRTASRLADGMLEWRLADLPVAT
jgi:rhodanese-related sulfurtransferase